MSHDPPASLSVSSNDLKAGEGGAGANLWPPVCGLCVFSNVLELLLVMEVLVPTFIDRMFSILFFRSVLRGIIHKRCRSGISIF